MVPPRGCEPPQDDPVLENILQQACSVIRNTLNHDYYVGFVRGQDKFDAVPLGHRCTSKVKSEVTLGRFRVYEIIAEGTRTNHLRSSAAPIVASFSGRSAKSGENICIFVCIQ